MAPTRGRELPSAARAAHGAGCAGILWEDWGPVGLELEVG